MANRNRMEMSKLLFERLVAAATQRGIDIANASEKRYIRRLSNEDAELMAGADPRTLAISRHVRMVRITFEGVTLFCVFGLAEPDQLPLGLEVVSLTPGVFAVGVLEARIQPLNSITASDIRDVVESQFIGAPEYEGHDLTDVAKLFPRAVVYRVAQDEPYLQSDYRVLGALLARSYVDGPIQISSDTIEKLWSTFESGSRFIPHQNLVQGLMAISWENLFLEAYRCLEQLYAEPRVSALKSQWHSKLPLRDLAVMLERYLSWRPKEDEALSKIISCCDPACVAGLCNAFGLDEPLSDNVTQRAESASRKVYELRNGIVHYRPIHEAIKKSDSEWDGIVSALLDVVNEVYELRGAPFFEVEVEPALAVA